MRPWVGCESTYVGSNPADLKKLIATKDGKALLLPKAEMGVAPTTGGIPKADLGRINKDQVSEEGPVPGQEV